MNNLYLLFYYFLNLNIKNLNCFIIYHFIRKIAYLKFNNFNLFFYYSIINNLNVVIIN